MADPEKVFKVERAGETLVVLPQGPALHFQHHEVHVESNALYRALDAPGMKNVVVDLSDVDYVDSVIISSILRCLTKTKQRRGKSVFCNASTNMQELLKSIKLGKLWPSFSSREEALAFIDGDGNVIT
jgi:anti-sigma B factor antagonist